MSYVKKPDNKVLTHEGHTPLDYSDKQQGLVKIFLAGSIEMGAAEDWQKRIANCLPGYDVLLFNPRRDDWDASWKQDIGNEQFNYQVSWELNRLEESDFIFMYLSPETKSPISLLELGLYANSGKMLVCCPNGFWRKGNVDIVCTRLNIPLYGTMDEAIEGLKTKIRLKNA